MKVMAEMTLYPEDLKGLKLNFTEAIYAITFGLEKEIRKRGKKAVFAEFDLSPGEMKERVDNCLETLLYDGENYALRAVLGDIDMSAVNRFGAPQKKPKEGSFLSAVRKLRSPVVSSWCIRPGSPRWFLVGKQESETENDATNYQSKGKSFDELCAQIQHLAAEAKMYEEKRNLVLARIAELTQVMQPRNDTTEDEFQETVSLDREGYVEQINWPYRSREILRELHLTTLGEVVEYFGDFDHFVNRRPMTLLEWAVVTSILHKKKLLPDCQEVTLDDDIREIWLSERAYSSLSSAQIYSIEDVVMRCADGARVGLDSIRDTQSFGQKSFNDFVQGLGQVTIKLDNAICFPTTSSSIRALDFNCEMRVRLDDCYKIKTIAELLVFYYDMKRFTGLQYIDPELYQVTQRQLKRYGLIDAD